MARRKLLAVGIADSQLKWLRCVSKAFEIKGYTVDYVASERSGMSVTPEILKSAGIESQPAVMSASAVADSDLCFEYDFIVVIDNGSNLLRFFHRFEKACRRHPGKPRPIVITGFIGMVLEKFVEGILWRTGADFILINSKRDEGRYRRVFENLGYGGSSLVRVGLPLIGGGETSRRDVRLPPRRVVFAAQPHFPEAKEERLYILENLIRYAEKHRDRSVVLKLRVPPGQRSFHKERFHYEQLFAEAGLRKPANFAFEYGPMSQQLKDADLLVTVSSTAALEAAALGIPFAIISDFGIKESIGTEAFIGSGAFASFEEIADDLVPACSFEWLSQNGVLEPIAENLAILVEEGERLLGVQSSSGSVLPLTKPFYLDSSFGAFYRKKFKV